MDVEVTRRPFTTDEYLRMIADTSLRRDREIKVPIYARAGIAEAWIVDVRGERMFVYRDPQGGTYQSVVDIGRDGTIAPAAFPDLRIAVDEVFR
jgi:Uma2 family endonuclease